MTDRSLYLRAAEIARLTGVSTRTVRRWIADEMLPSTKLGGARLVARAELERLLSSSSGPGADPMEEAEECDGSPST